ncbi:hypothetical protein yaldo0001_12410 [Yersinia aldovae ATCC 35236]|nr:hypothetical protein yaldo0001_12410 [Yersinia aldovae ATCC 35236]
MSAQRDSLVCCRATTPITLGIIGPNLENLSENMGVIASKTNE